MTDRSEERIPKNRHRRRRHECPKSVTTEDTQLSKKLSVEEPLLSTHRTVEEQNINENKQTSHLSSVRQRVRILPGEEMMKGCNRKGAYRPREPSETPPVPEQMIKFLVLGDGSQLVHQFCHRESRGVKNQDCRQQQHRSSASRSSSWSVDYHKKDISFWLNESIATCVRTQIWDVISNGGISHRCGEWKALTKNNWNTIVIVGSISNGYEALEENVRYWKDLLDRSLSPSSSPDRAISTRSALPVSLLLINNADDEASSSKSIDPSIWFSIGSNVSSLCQELGIQDWHLISDLDGNLDNSDDSSCATVERIFMSMIRYSLKHPRNVLNASLQHNLPKNNDQQPPESISRPKSRKASNCLPSPDHYVVEAQAFPIFSPR